MLKHIVFVAIVALTVSQQLRCPIGFDLISKDQVLQTTSAADIQNPIVMAETVSVTSALPTSSADSPLSVEQPNSRFVVTASPHSRDPFYFMKKSSISLINNIRNPIFGHAYGNAGTLKGQ